MIDWMIASPNCITIVDHISSSGISDINGSHNFKVQQKKFSPWQLSGWRKCFMTSFVHDTIHPVTQEKMRTKWIYVSSWFGGTRSLRTVIPIRLYDTVNIYFGPKVYHEVKLNVLCYHTSVLYITYRLVYGPTMTKKLFFFRYFL